MVKTCCVKNCDIGPKANVTCFRFPNNRFLKRKWIDAIGLSNKLTATSTVCIKHFQPDDYDIVRGRPRLKAKVIPSIFCESDKHSISPCMTEDDLISKEINTEITLKSIQKEKLEALQVIDLQNEDSTESQDDNTEDERNENSTKLVNEEKTETEKACRTEVEDSVKLENNDSTTINDNVGPEHDDDKSVTDNLRPGHDENRTESQNEGTKESQSMPSADLQNDSGVELLSDKAQNEGSTKSDEEGSVQKKNENVEEEKSKKTKPNGVIAEEKKVSGFQDSFVKSTIKPRGGEDLNKDIEDILVNYQIPLTRPLPAADPESTELDQQVEAEPEEEGLLKESDPVFIEVAVQGAAGDRAGSPRDCLMVLESVQVELDPSTFLADPDNEDCHETVDLDDDDDDDDHRDGHHDGSRPDPISLLTSSDEDEVIIQEPHIDTVEVSDETDEDDLPLVKLLNRKRKRPPASAPYEYFCMECQYSASSKRDYRAHAARHSTILQVCEVCDYTTASKSQFSRHKRKHKDDRKFKCHLCDYRARHNMSLIYHLKSHRALSSAKKGFKCDKCGFQSDVKTAVLKHVKLCTTNVKKYTCDKCVYETKRPSDLRRHKARRHNDDDDDDEEFVPGTVIH